MKRYGSCEAIRAAKEQVRAQAHPTGVAEIILDRPEKRNALSVPMRDRITDLVHQFDDDDGTRVIVIRGEGPSFCSGAELNEDWGQREPGYKRYTPTHAYRYSNEMTWGRGSFSQAILRSRKVVIAEVHGYCAAVAYFLLAATCDIVVASTDAQIGALEARFLGPASSVASVRLNRILGSKVARQLGYTGQPMSGDDAFAYGFAHKVVHRDDLPHTVRTLADDIASRSRDELEYLRARIRAGESHMDTLTPVITGFLASHFLQAAPDEHSFWNSVRSGGIKEALDEDKRRSRLRIGGHGDHEATS